MRSHPGARALGVWRAMTVGRGLDTGHVALGGMTEKRWLAIRRFGFDGWAAIDGLMPGRR